MWLNTDSPSEVLLNPAFLKFMGVCVLIGAMLDRGGADMGLMTAQQIALLWPVIGIQSIFWFGFVFLTLQFLHRRGILSSIYTPIIVIPQLVLTQLTTFLVAYSLNPEGAHALQFFVGEMLRDVVLLLAYDVLFSSYVVHQHSAFSRDPVVLNAPEYPSQITVSDNEVAQNERTQSADIAVVLAAPAQTAANETATLPPTPTSTLPATTLPAPTLPAPPPPPAAPEIKLGSKVFSADEIEMIRSEDHYLAIFTANRKDLVRARMSESVAKLDIRYGVQVNRSTWVAFTMVDKLVKTDAIFEVHLKNGSIETVAAVRRHAVNAAYELFLRQSSER